MDVNVNSSRLARWTGTNDRAVVLSIPSVIFRLSHRWAVCLSQSEARRGFHCVSHTWTWDHERR